MTKKITLPEETVTCLERLDYEQNATKNLLLDAAERGISSGDAFEHWETKFQEAFAAFQMEKNEVTEQYVRPVSEGKDSDWTLDYRTGELTVTLKG